MSNEAEQVIAELQALANPHNLAGMARYGINTHNTLGISIYELRKVARRIGINHVLAQELWESGLHEARILAGFIADSQRVDRPLLERWVAGFDSWDLCDQVCDLIARSAFAYTIPYEWAQRPEEFVKRAAFAVIAHLAWHDKMASDEKLAQFFPLIYQHADDERNFVKKAINWALRNLGKRSRGLNAQAVACAQQIHQRDSRAARWIASDALRELSSDKVRNRLKE